MTIGVMDIFKTILVLLALTAPLRAANPIITHLYTADPAARVFDGALYLYPSHDRDDATWWDMEDWHVFSTTDLKTFTDHGVAFRLTDTAWAKRFAWAPDCVERNGKYYFYYPTDQSNIGVAVADKPIGPFKDPLGKPLLTRESKGVVAPRDFIDPCVFVDNDGQAYLFVGQSVVNAVRLNEDMISCAGDAVQVEGLDGFFEAVWVHKRGGVYYMSYSAKNADGRDEIRYATSDRVLGPYKYRGVILDPVNSGTNHHSIVEFKGRSYLFYHTADLSLAKLPEGSPERQFAPWRRSVCVDRLEYDPDGSIRKVIPTKAGPPPVDMPTTRVSPRTP